jgi:hypothetical protein
VRFSARQAAARAHRLLGLGPLEEVVVSGAETDLEGPVSSAAELDILSRPTGRAGIKRVLFEDTAVSFTAGGRAHRVGGMVWEADLSERRTGISINIDALRIEGADSAGLEAEAPSIGFRVDIEGTLVRVKSLNVAGRSGWRAAGDVQADLGGDVPELRGELDLWDLALSRIYKPPPGVEVSARSRVARKISLAGPANDLRIEAATDLRNVSYADRGLGLSAGEVNLSVRTAGRVDLFDLLDHLLKGGSGRPEAQDAESDI